MKKKNSSEQYFMNTDKIHLILKIKIKIKKLFEG